MKVILEDLDRHKKMKAERKIAAINEDIALMEENNRILDEKEARRAAYFKFLATKSQNRGDKFLETVLTQQKAREDKLEL